MHIGNNPNLNIGPVQGFHTTPALSAKRDKTEGEQQATSSNVNASLYTEKAKRLNLLEQFQKYSYGAQLLSGTQKAHNQNVDRVHEQVEAFVEKFVAENADVTPVQIRAGISRNIGQILKDAQLDISCYEASGSGKAQYGKHLIFSSLSIPLLKDAPLCFQLFHFKPGQTTPIHNHPNPTEDPSKVVMVECASYVVDGMVNERLYGRRENDQDRNPQAEKTNKEFRDAGNRRDMDNPGTNPPHSLKNAGDKPAATVHAYTMDGISDGHTIAVQAIFKGIKNSTSAVYVAYDALVEKLKTGTQKIAAKDLLAALKANKFGANPVIVDIRESKEVQKHDALHIEGANMLHAPRGVAIAKILKDFPDRNAHLVLFCRDGARSALLADELRALGYESTMVADGANGCKEQGLMQAYDTNPATVDKWSDVFDVAPSALTEHIQQLKSNISVITPEELATGLKKESVVVFDVRQENERSSGVIPNAQRVPAGDFEKKARFHAHDLSTPIAIYSGDDGDYRALVAAKNLMEMGYSNVKYLEGGYQSYTDQGLSATGEGARSGSVALAKYEEP